MFVLVSVVVFCVVHIYICVCVFRVDVVLCVSYLNIYSLWEG